MPSPQDRESSTASWVDVSAQGSDTCPWWAAGVLHFEMEQPPLFNLVWRNNRFFAHLRGKIVALKQVAAVYRNMLRDVGADDSLPALDMENLAEPAPQPMADAYRDTDQHSSDEIMEPKEDAEDALPLGDDVVQAHALPAARHHPHVLAVPSPCRGISEDTSCDMKTVRRCGRIGVSFCSATSTDVHGQQNDQRAANATLWAERACGLLCCVGESFSPNRSTKEQSSRELLRCRASASGFKTTASCREPQFKRQTKRNFREHIHRNTPPHIKDTTTPKTP